MEFVSALEFLCRARQLVSYFGAYNYPIMSCLSLFTCMLTPDESFSFDLSLKSTLHDFIFSGEDNQLCWPNAVRYQIHCHVSEKGLEREIPGIARWRNHEGSRWVHYLQRFVGFLMAYLSSKVKFNSLGYDRSGPWYFSQTSAALKSVKACRENVSIFNIKWQQLAFYPQTFVINKHEVRTKNRVSCQTQGNIL